MQMSMFDEQVRLSTEPFMTYRGSKSRVWQTLARSMPSGLTELVSPFVGGGGFELRMAASGIRVHGYDTAVGVVRLWKAMLDDAGAVVREVLKDFPGDRDALKDMILNGTIYNVEDDLEFAALAWKVSRYSFNGDFLKTPWVHNNHDDEYVIKKFGNYFDVEKWSEWGNDNMSVEMQDWQTTLYRHPDAFLYCDPPYVGLENYYGAYGQQSDFDHVKFATSMKQRDNGWVISYIDHPILRDLYDGYEFVDLDWHQSSKNFEGSHDNRNREVVILKPPATNPHRFN